MGIFHVICQMFMFFFSFSVFVFNHVVNGCQVVPDISCAVSCSPSSAGELGLDSRLVVMITLASVGLILWSTPISGIHRFLFHAVDSTALDFPEFFEEPFLCKILMPRRDFWCVQKDV